MSTWTVKLTRKAEKQVNKLPKDIKARLFTLLVEIEKAGPIEKIGKTMDHSKGIRISFTAILNPASLLMLLAGKLKVRKSG